MIDLKPCPHCGGPTVNVAGEYATCGAAWNSDCDGHQLRLPIKLWNTIATALHNTSPIRE